MPSAPAPGLMIASWLDCPGCDRAGRILQLLTSTSHPHRFLSGSKVGGFILEFRLCRQVQHTNPILTPHQWQRAFALVLEDPGPDEVQEIVASQPRSTWGSSSCLCSLSRLMKEGGWLPCVLTDPTGFSRPPGSERALKALYKGGIYQAVCKGT